MFDAEVTDEGRMHVKLAPYSEFEGDVPEPTTEQIEDFFTEWRDISLSQVEFAESLTPKDQAGKPKDETARQMRERELAQREKIKKFSADILRRRAEALAALCSDTPNVEDIMSLPGRKFIEFQNYMMGELTPND